MKYIVNKIMEADFGCEERPEGYGAMALLYLRDENGNELTMEVPDADLYASDINAGDLVSFTPNNKIYKEL